MTHSNTTRAAVLDQFGDILADANLPANVREIEIAGARSIDGGPVNRKTYKVSRSQRNLNKARTTMAGLTAFDHHGETYYLLAE